MATRFYVAMFDDASHHFLNEVFGWKGNRDENGKLGRLDMRHVINYKQGLVAGNLLEIHAGMGKIAGSSITKRRMYPRARLNSRFYVTRRRPARGTRTYPTTVR